MVHAQATGILVEIGSCSSAATHAPPSLVRLSLLWTPAGPEQGGSGPDLLMVHLDAQDLKGPAGISLHPNDAPTALTPQSQETGPGATALHWLDALVGKLLQQKAVSGGVDVCLDLCVCERPLARGAPACFVSAP